MHASTCTRPPRHREHARWRSGAILVIGLRRPFAGAPGRVVRILDGLHGTGVGGAVRSAIVRFGDGRTAVVPLANLEVTEGV